MVVGERQRQTTAMMLPHARTGFHMIIAGENLEGKKSSRNNLNDGKTKEEEKIN